MPNQLSVLSGYVRTSRALAKPRGDLYAAVVFAKMAVCRLLRGIDDVNFAYYNLQNKSLRRCLEYLTKHEMDVLEEQINNYDKNLLDDKIRFWNRATSVSLPTPDILAVLNPERVDAGVPAHVPQIFELGQLEAFLTLRQGQRLVLKLAAGSYGVGMASVQVGDTLTDHLGNALSSNDLLQHCLTTLSQTGSGQRDLPSARCYVIQEHVLPHSSLQPVMPGLALGTFRIVTYIDRRDCVSIPFAFAKIPRRHSLNDNFHHGTTGNLLCGIHISDGRLMDARGKIDPTALFIECIEQHPDSGFRFQDFSIPQWQAVLDVARHAARAFPEFRTVGWDVALTSTGPMILEGNWHYDPDGPQITLDRGIKSEVRRLFET